MGKLITLGLIFAGFAIHPVLGAIAVVVSGLYHACTD